MSSIKSKLNHLTLSVATAGLISTSAVIQAATLEEVVVTATKRAESVQDVPISVAVVSGEFINTFDISDVTDLQNFVPSLQVQETFGSTAVRVRGLGSGITNLAFDSSVPLYIDDVYSGRGNALLAASMDMDRFEVARGPQGALFGKSTIAGAISATTARPTEEFEAEIKVGTELEDGGYKASGYVSGPLSDNARGRLAFLKGDLDGYTDNLTTGHDDGAEEQEVVRVSLEFDVNDSTTMFLKVEDGTKDIYGRNNQLVAPGAMSSQTTDPNVEYKADNKRSVSTGLGKEDTSTMEWSIATLSIETEVAGHSLKAIASQWDYTSHHFLDVDGHPEDILTTDLDDDYESTSFEVRLLSPSDQVVEYILGYWYQDSTLNTQQWSKFAPRFWSAVTGVPLAVGPNVPPLAGAFTYGSGTDRVFSRDSEAFSIYAQATLNFSDRIRAIVDLRYTEEEQDGIGQTFNMLFDQPGALDYSRVPRSTAGHNQAYTFYQKRTDDSIDPSLRIQWDATHDLMVYVGYAGGSKAGGLKANDGALGNQLAAKLADTAYIARYTDNPALDAAGIEAGVRLKTGNGIFDFENEEASSYEFGFKSTLLDGRATLNGAFFTTDFKNLQTSNYDGTAFIIGNAGQANVTGFELEASLQATDNLRLNAAVGSIDAKYDDYQGAQCVVNADGSNKNSDCIGGRENQKGEPLERSPDLEWNLNAMWSQPLSNGMTLKAAGSVYYSDSYFVQPTQDPSYAVQDSYTKYDMRVALAGQDDKWEIGVNGRNLGDEMVISHAYNIAGSKFNNLSRGRTITLEGIYRF